MSDPEDADFEEDMREFMDAALEAGPHFQQNLFHPNLFHNIIAGEGIIFQYDNPYDSDDDDYDYFDDDDFFNDDFEVDNCRKIFVTLQDSHVINRLSFHKKAQGHFRFPYNIPDKEECYEDMYRLLEELELMVRVWRKRSEHPYTAHLRSEAKAGTGPGSGEKLVEGEDYNQSDYEYDGEDEDPYHYVSVSAPNEALTKKKFCQSVKIYQKIFDTDKQFDIFQRTVMRMKKYVFRVVFQVFLDTLPPATATRLPRELWEKIWKYTQNGYFRYKGSVPLLEDERYYKAGQRVSRSSLGLWQAEQERIGELFGAIGNLHISLFEILFKNPFFLQEHHLMIEELESGGSEGNMLRITRILWWKHYRLVCQKFARLRQLDAYLSSSDEGLPEQPKPTLFQAVEKGIYTIQDVPTELDMKHRNDLTTCQTGNILVSMEDCSIVAVIDHYFIEKENDYFLTLILCEATTGKVVGRIRTGLKYSLFQIELAKFAMRRLGKTGWRRNLCLTKDRISILYCDNSAQSPSIKVWSHRLMSAPEEVEDVQLMEPLLNEAFKEIPGVKTFSIEPKTSIFHSADKVVVCFQPPFRRETFLNVYDGASGELILNVDWLEEELLMVGFKLNRALLVNYTTGAILFFSTDSGETILTLPFSNLNEGSQSYGPWTGLFDSTPDVQEFSLIRSDNSKFQLYSYDSGNEMSKPSLEFSGTIHDTYKLTSECLNTAKLKNGTIFFNRRTHLPQESSLDEMDCYHEISALSLRAQACCPIITMCSAKTHLGITKYNELSLNHFDPKYKFSDFLQSTVVETFDPAKRPLFFINSTSFGVLLELGKIIKIFNFDHDERSVLTAEVEANEERERRRQEEAARFQRIKQENDRKVAEKREKLLQQRKAMEEEFVNKEERLRGRVEEWRGTYGFVRCRGRAYRLGRVFFHRSDVAGHEKRRFFRNGTELEFNLINGRDQGTYQAVKITVVPPKEGTQNKN